MSEQSARAQSFSSSHTDRHRGGPSAHADSPPDCFARCGFRGVRSQLEATLSGDAASLPEPPSRTAADGQLRALLNPSREPIRAPPRIEPKLRATILRVLKVCVVCMCICVYVCLRIVRKQTSERTN